MERYVVVLERGDKLATIILSASDYTASVKFDRGNNPKMRWGSGPMWRIVRVVDYEAYQNQTDSKPF